MGNTIRGIDLRLSLSKHGLTAAVLVGAALAAAPSQTARAAKTIWDGIYTEAQARRGEQVFKTERSYLLLGL